MNALLVLSGPTGTGKTELSLQLGEAFGAPVISADSRQLYKDLSVGTAAPSPEQLARIRHYMIGTLALEEYYSASRFEEEVLALLKDLFATHPVVLMAGGSMMYIDAICKGLDEIPTVTPDVRKALWTQYEREGMTFLLEELQTVDPVHYQKVDRMNHRRVIHALEICRMTGRPYSSFCTRTVRERPFQIIRIGLDRPREELYERINRRVDRMMADGFVDEARRVYPFRHLNALNTVGYKELFRYFDGEWSLNTAVEKIKRNTRVYARKQMTWFKRDKNIDWFHPDDKTAILTYVEKAMNGGR
jgi:tRNA dimethylallyltransferase